MTRRIVLFWETETDQMYRSVEFNGDKNEYERLGSLDSCDAHWNSILKEFEGCFTLEAFNEANARASAHYYSYFGNESPTPVELVEDLSEVAYANELYVVIDGIPYPYTVPKKEK